MRDIRADLQDRVNFLKEQIDAARAQFDEQVDQIKKEHDGKLKALKADLDAVNTLFGAERRRLGNAPSAPEAQPQPAKPQPQGSSPQPAQPHRAGPRLPISEMLRLQRTG